VRGLFGLEWSAEGNTLTITPSLPADWNEAKLMRIPVAQSHVDVEMRRNGSMLTVRVSGAGSKTLKLQSRGAGARMENGELRIPLPAAEVGIAHGTPEAGSRTSKMKVLDQQYSPRSLRLRLSAPANSHQTLFLRLNDPKMHLRIEGAEISSDSGAQIRAQFPPGNGYVEKTVTLSW
jgi:microcompartment protein CcmK/EutM